MAHPFGENISPNGNENDPTTFEEFFITVKGLYAIADSQLTPGTDHDTHASRVNNAIDKIDELGFTHPGWLNRYIEETGFKQAS